MDIDINRFSQGNIFKTKEEANLESNRRTLLAKFREFRNERSEGWKPDWTDINESKWSAVLSDGELLALSMYSNNSFDTFGHFKNQEDCQRAIEIFGKEIIELFRGGVKMSSKIEMLKNANKILPQYVWRDWRSC